MPEVQYLVNFTIYLRMTLQPLCMTFQTFAKEIIQLDLLNSAHESNDCRGARLPAKRLMGAQGDMPC